MSPSSGKIVGFAGSLSQPSRTRALVQAAVDGASDRYSLESEVFDLLDLAPSLGAAKRLSDLAPGAMAVARSIVSADALVLGSPVYKGSYGGLFKHLFDLLDPACLAGRPVLLCATGGGARHALVIEHQLRPLLGFFEALTLPTGVYAADSDFRDGALVDGPTCDRLNRGIAQLAPFFNATDQHGRLSDWQEEAASFASSSRAAE